MTIKVSQKNQQMRQKVLKRTSGALFKFTAPLVNLQNKAVQKLFTRLFFSCKRCKNLFTLTCLDAIHNIKTNFKLTAI